MKTPSLLAAGFPRLSAKLSLLLAAPLLLLGTTLSNSDAPFTYNITGSLNTARCDHTTTLLPNGKVLVAGGSDSNLSALASAELYDPASGTWTATGSLNTGRFAHTATLLPNGEVLVAGGRDSNNNASTSVGIAARPGERVLGRPRTASTPHALVTRRPCCRAERSRSLQGDDRNNNASTSAGLYDPANGSWTVTNSPLTGRVYHTATLRPNGKVLVAGGERYQWQSLTSAEL